MEQKVHLSWQPSSHNGLPNNLVNRRLDYAVASARPERPHPVPQRGNVPAY